MGAVFSYVSVNIPPLKKKQTQKLQKEMMISPEGLLLEGKMLHSTYIPTGNIFYLALQRKEEE